MIEGHSGYATGQRPSRGNFITAAVPKIVWQSGVDVLRDYNAAFRLAELLDIATGFKEATTPTGVTFKFLPPGPSFSQALEATRFAIVRCALEGIVERNTRDPGDIQMRLAV